MSYDNALYPDLRDLARRLALVEQHLGLRPEQLAAQFVLDPPPQSNLAGNAAPGSPAGEFFDMVQNGWPDDVPSRYVDGNVTWIDGEPPQCPQTPLARP